MSKRFVRRMNRRRRGNHDDELLLNKPSTTQERSEPDAQQLAHAVQNPGELTPDQITHLQQTVGNQAVINLMSPNASPQITITGASDNIQAARRNGRNDPALAGSLGYLTDKALRQAQNAGLDSGKLKELLSKTAISRGEEGVRLTKSGFILTIFGADGPYQFTGNRKGGLVEFNTLVHSTEYAYS